MINFSNDYSYTAAPEVMEALAKRMKQSMPSYGLDPITESARDLIRQAIGKPDAEVRFLSGGTQTNAIALDTLIPRIYGIIAAKTAHIALHEAGAIEFTGHKVLELPSHDGKISAEELTVYLKNFHTDSNREYMVQPGIVYITYSTELGTLYTAAEVREIARICHSNGLLLYVDGARMAYALAASANDVDLPLLAKRCDAICIGGTKCGGMFGEALVFPDPATMPAHFDTSIRQHGALLAKGWLIAQQFQTLFENNLYLRFGKIGDQRAKELAEILHRHHLELAVPLQTNQVFVRISNKVKEKLEQRVTFSDWEPIDASTSIIRLVASWATTDAEMSEMEQMLNTL